MFIIFTYSVFTSADMLAFLSFKYSEVRWSFGRVMNYLYFLSLSLPAEFTTMAGRRLRDAVRTVLTSDGSGEFGSNVQIVIAGLSNTYSQYVTTFEEYQIQRYEVH